MQPHDQVELLNLLLKSLITMNGVKVQNIDTLGRAMAVFIDKKLEIESGPDSVLRTHCAWDIDKEELFLWA